MELHLRGTNDLHKCQDAKGGLFRISLQALEISGSLYVGRLCFAMSIALDSAYVTLHFELDWRPLARVTIMKVNLKVIAMPQGHLFA